MALGRSWRMQRKALFFVHLVLWSDHGISALRDSLSGERDFLEHDNEEASCLRLANLKGGGHLRPLRLKILKGLPFCDFHMRKQQKR